MLRARVLSPIWSQDKLSQGSDSTSKNQRVSRETGETNWERVF